MINNADSSIDVSLSDVRDNCAQVELLAVEEREVSFSFLSLSVSDRLRVI